MKPLSPTSALAQNRAARAPKHTWSEEQEIIFAAMASLVPKSATNFVIKARAGTGKTATSKEGFRYVPESFRKILYAVFNKRNQKEAEEKIVDPRVEVLTLHSVGYRFVRNVWRNAKPDDDVEFDRAAEVCGYGDAAKPFIAAVVKLVGFAKNTCIAPTEADLLSIIDAQDIVWDSNRELCGAALRVLELSRVPDKAGRISFNDMVWLPVAMGWVKPSYDLVLIDEAQDMNLPQLTMARLASRGPVIVVGDDRQAIYGFRGAVQDGLEMMRKTLAAHELTLTTTYRCAKSIVRLAQEVVPDYKWHDASPEGSVQNVNQFAMMGTVAVGDAILSRLNAPLMPLALSLLRKNIPARIEGRDIGKQLVGMVRSMKAKSVPNFLEKVQAWSEKQIARLNASKSKNIEKKVEQVSDIAATLCAIAEGASSVNDIEARITNLFSDTDSNSKPAVVLSSVHKAKGLEWNRVFCLTETFRRGKGREEDNIYYVAITRAQRELYMVGASGNSLAEQKPASVEAAKVAAPSKQAPPKRMTEVEMGVRTREDYKAIVGEPLPEPPPELVQLEVGHVVSIAGHEQVVTVVESDSAVIRIDGSPEVSQGASGF
jgi:hypothetical protein